MEGKEKGEYKISEHCEQGGGKRKNEKKKNTDWEGGGVRKKRTKKVRKRKENIKGENAKWGWPGDRNG